MNSLFSNGNTRGIASLRKKKSTRILIRNSKEMPSLTIYIQKKELLVLNI